MQNSMLISKKQFRRMAGLTACGLWWAMQAPAHAQPTEPQPPTPIETVTVEQAQQLMGGPTLVTLNFDNAAPRTVYEELFRQANIPLFPYLVPELWAHYVKLKPVTVHFERKPLWEAAQELEKQTGLVLFSTMGNRGYALISREDMKGTKAYQQGPSLISGPFQIGLGEITTSHTTATNRPPAKNPPQEAGKNEGTKNEGTRQVLTLNVMPDPKFAWSRVLDVQTEVAVDEQGNSLLLPEPEWKKRMPFVYNFTVPLDLARPAGKNGDGVANAQGGNMGGGVGTGHKVSHLKGKIRVAFASVIQTWEMPDLRNSVSSTKVISLPEGREGYTIQKLDTEGKNLRLTYMVSSSTPEALRREDFKNTPQTPRPVLRSDMMQRGVHDAMSMVFADGTVRRSGGGSGGGSVNNWEYTISFVYPEGVDNQSPAKLIWPIPVEWKIVEVPFEFTNVPLP